MICEHVPDYHPHGWGEVCTNECAAPAPVDPCPHCAADNAILEEKIEAVVHTADKLMEQWATPARARIWADHDERRHDFLSALRDLVREVRRG